MPMPTCPRLESAQRRRRRDEAVCDPGSVRADGVLTVNVLLVDDSADVQASFGGLVGSIPGVTLAGCAGDVAGALSMIASLQPDLVVLDVGLAHGESGIEVLRHVTHAQPGLPVIVLSNFSWQAVRTQLLDAGAAAYFDKANEFQRALDWIAARAEHTTPTLPPPPPVATPAR